MKRKTAYMGLFLSIALICSYIESLIPFYFGVPGVKLGLTNVVVVLVLYCIGAKEALIISVSRILLAGLMFGNPFSIIYSLSGGLLSFFIMWLMKKSEKLSVIPVSITGGIFHNIGQLMIAALVVENYRIVYYMPILMVAGCITGFLIGVLAGELIERLKKMI